jgi:spore coat protein U-like protein
VTGADRPRRAAAACLVVLLAAAVAPVRADSAGRPVQSCVVSVTPLRFGPFEPRNPAASMMTGSVVFNCALSQPVAIFMDHGRGPPAGERFMEGPGSIPYDIYFDAGATRIWGDGTGGTSFYSNPAPPPGTNVVIPFFGRIAPPRSPLRAGGFTDTVIVRMSY